jgi:signal transduction histidine kinase
LALINLISNALKFTSTQAEAKSEIGSVTGEQNKWMFFARDSCSVARIASKASTARAQHSR